MLASAYNLLSIPIEQLQVSRSGATAFNRSDDDTLLIDDVDTPDIKYPKSPNSKIAHPAEDQQQHGREQASNPGQFPLEPGNPKINR